MTPVADFARKLGSVLRTLNLSRGRLAQTLGLDKSVVSRWASGATVPSDHNLALLTEAVASHKPGFGRADWDLDPAAFAQRIAAEAGSLERPAVAVLPFINMAGDTEHEYFADGITEDIITALSKWRSLLVIARNSTFTYKGRNVDLRLIGRELGVRYVVQGSVRRAGGPAGGRLRITAQLTEANSGTQLWAERYDGDLADIFGIQDQVTESVASAIEPAVAEHEHSRTRNKPPGSLAAWDLLLRGRWHHNQFSADETVRAVECFDRALELDPGLADAHVALARCRLSEGIYGYRPDRAAMFAACADAARRALHLDPQNALAYYTLAIVEAHGGDGETALDHARQAVRLNTNLAPAYFALAIACSYTGRPEEALAAIDTALRLSPTDSQKFAWLAQRASALYLCRRYDEAIETARQSMAVRWFHTACRVMAASCGQLGHQAEARAAVAQLLAASEGADKSIAQVVQFFRRPADRDLYTAGLRKAGLPEA